MHLRPTRCLTVISTSALRGMCQWLRRGRADARRCVAAASTGLVISAFIVGSVRFHRDGLARILVDDGRVRVLGSAPPGPQTSAQIRDLLPQVVLLDTTAPGRLEQARGILDAVPEATIVALALADDEVVSCAEAGICGYVEPEASIGNLVATLESVARGEVPCSPRVGSALMRRVAALAAGSAPGHTPKPLTAREREILELMMQGQSNKEIAQRLRIEVPTVKTHVHHIFAKLQLRRRAEAAAVMREFRGTVPVSAARI
jgi:two-component system, NarL family, nitrate/nitrite response regulator NarL